MRSVRDTTLTHNGGGFVEGITFLRLNWDSAETFHISQVLLKTQESAACGNGLMILPCLSLCLFSAAYHNHKNPCRGQNPQFTAPPMRQVLISCRWLCGMWSRMCQETEAIHPAWAQQQGCNSSPGWPQQRHQVPSTPLEDRGVPHLRTAQKLLSRR